VKNGAEAPLREDSAATDERVIHSKECKLDFGSEFDLSTAGHDRVCGNHVRRRERRARAGPLLDELRAWLAQTPSRVRAA